MTRKFTADERARLDEANTAYLRKEYEAAHAILSVLSVDHPYDEKVQFGLIKCLVKRGENDLAKVVCARFLEHTESPKVRDVFRALGGESAESAPEASAPTTRWRLLALGAGGVIALALIASAGILSVQGEPAASPAQELVPATASLVPVPALVEAPPEPDTPAVEPAPEPPAPPAQAAAPARTGTAGPAQPARTPRRSPPPFTKEVLWTDREFTAWTTSWGDYLEYRPRNVRSNPQVIVTAHGSVTDDENALRVSQNYIQRARWMAVAERTGNIIVAPVFDRTRYRRYNRLQGGPAGADGFVLAIVDSYSDYERPFFLYGHSAGGQFTHRFLLTHPHRIERAVVSAAGNYAFPDPSVEWPYGMKGAPNPDGWLAATRVPLTIVVGARDTRLNPSVSTHQHGDTRIERARNWAAQMRDYAARNGNPNCSFQVYIVPDAGHGSSGTVNSGAHHLLPPDLYQATRQE